MAESATNDDHDDLCDLLPELVDEDSSDSFTEEWSTDSDDEFVQDEEFTNRDR